MSFFARVPVSCTDAKTALALPSSKPEDSNPVMVADATTAKLLDACSKSAVGSTYAPAAVSRAMGKKTRSMKRSKGAGEIIWSLAKPVSFKLPSNDNRVFKVNDRYTISAITSSTSTTVAGCINMVINSIGNITPLQQIFDQYRITKIEVLFIPQANYIAAAATATPGMFHTVVDYDDSTNLASEQAALDYENVLTGSFSDGQRRSFVPHAAIAAYQGTFTGYANVASPWIDAAYPSVNHFGVKYWVTQASTASLMDVYITLFCEWRNVR